MTGGNNVAVRTRGVFDECLTNGNRRFDSGGLNLRHYLKYAVFGDRRVGSNADQRKISVFHQNIAGNGPHGPGQFLFRPRGSLVTGMALNLGDPD